MNKITVLKLPTVIKLSGLARATIYKHIKTGNFPQPIKMTSKSIGFIEHEIEKWLQEKADQRPALNLLKD